MAKLASIEKIKLEKIFQMGGGYVLDFTDRTFQEFFMESMDIDIYADKYAYASGSKANRLRGFWQKELDYTVGRLIEALLEYWRERKEMREEPVSDSEKKLYEDCLRIADRLKQNQDYSDVDAIKPLQDQEELSLLEKSAKEAIKSNHPELALDRLHTYFLKYLRKICNRHSITYDRNKALHSMFGEYVKYLVKNNFIESVMSERILRTSISILESYNDIRNNKSLAHDNPLLNYQESVLIVSYILATLKFIQYIEGQIRRS